MTYEVEPVRQTPAEWSEEDENIISNAEAHTSRTKLKNFLRRMFQMEEQQ